MNVILIMWKVYFTINQICLLFIFGYNILSITRISNIETNNTRHDQGVVEVSCLRSELTLTILYIQSWGINNDRATSLVHISISVFVHSPIENFSTNTVTRSHLLHLGAYIEFTIKSADAQLINCLTIKFPILRKLYITNCNMWRYNSDIELFYNLFHSNWLRRTLFIFKIWWEPLFRNPDLTENKMSLLCRHSVILCQLFVSRQKTTSEHGPKTQVTVFIIYKLCPTFQHYILDW